jgi:hypothetical protein
LGNATKAKLERVANDARGLDRLNPEAVKRQAHLESLRVPIRTTAGRLSRDDAQLIKEEGVAGTNAGKPIRDIDIAANRDLRRNVEVLVDRLRGVGASRAPTLRGEKVGEVLAGRDPQTPGILTKRQRLAKAKTKAAYDEALKSEPDAEANGAPLFEYFKSNPSVQHVGWMSDWLNRAKVSIKEGETQPNRGLKLVELDDLRKKALKIGPTSPDFHYASDVIASIDEIMNDVPDSAVKWKAARAAHAAERAEFKNQGSIDRLVGTKGGRWGTDPKTDLEDVWKVSVKNASAAEVRQLKRSLLGGEDAATRLQGKQALRTVRAATAQNLLENITAKGISTNEAGEANITADSIGRWVKSMGQDGTLPGGWEKLEVIFGRKATRELKDILEAAQIVKTAPTTRVSGSNTFQNILNWMDDTGLGKVGKKIAGPVGDIAAGIKGAVEKPAIVRAAKESATSAAERTGGRLSDAETQRLQREQLRGAPPPTYRGEQP